MTLTELRYIVAVARERHFGKAARACHVSQPTLSVAIKKLEEELGVSTFVRSLRAAIKEYLEDPLGAPLIPNWNRVDAALPNFLDAFNETVRLDNTTP